METNSFLYEGTGANLNGSCKLHSLYIDSVPDLRSTSLHRHSDGHDVDTASRGPSVPLWTPSQRNKLPGDGHGGRQLRSDSVLQGLPSCKSNSLNGGDFHPLLTSPMSICLPLQKAFIFPLISLQTFVILPQNCTFFRCVEVIYKATYIAVYISSHSMLTRSATSFLLRRQ